jgi:transposase
MVEEGKGMAVFQREIKKSFIIHKTGGKDKKAMVEIIQEEIEKALATCGWMVILGNGKLNVQQAHDIYRQKDVVEKAFMKYKNFLGLDRLRVHGGQRMMNKLFIAFLSLILVFHIHSVMKEKELYRKMTMEKLLMIMSKLKMVAINGHNISSGLYPKARGYIKGSLYPQTSCRLNLGTGIKDFCIIRFYRFHLQD